MSTTPTTPQWMQDAVKEIHPWEVAVEGAGSPDDMQSGYDENEENLQEDQRILAIIAKHAPPLSPPTDEAGLREVIENTILAEFAPSEPTEWTTGLAHRLTAALAPHLSQREPGDSELLKFIRDNCRVVFYPPNGAYPIEHAPFAKKDMWEHLKSAQRGEGKP